MPANIGQMFYYGDVPWHGEGVALSHPATLEEALEAGGLDWRVGEADLFTGENPRSPVPRRKAIVRLDRPPGHKDRVLGVTHRGFKPMQNRDGAVLFDAIFGEGHPVYHTGGYLGSGEIVWLLAKLGNPFEVAPNDVIEPYALYANSHDGSMAINIRLTTIRVVCRNTLGAALRHRRGLPSFSRAHRGTLVQHAEAAREFFDAMMQDLNDQRRSYESLTRKRCDGEKFELILKALLPDPRRPKQIDRNIGLVKAYEKRLAEVRAARAKISELRETGHGMQLEGSKGTYWGVLNAILEFIDHHKEVKGSRVNYALFGDGMEFKTKAFNLIQEVARAA